MSTGQLRDLVASLLVETVPVAVGALERIDMPHRIVTVWPAGGPGAHTEEAALERVAFQVRARGRPSARTDDAGAVDDALALIEGVDDGLLDVRAHDLPGGGLVAWVERAAGAPSVAEPDAGGRYVAACSYIAVTG